MAVKKLFDRYATAKSGAEMLLTIGLLADTIREIYDFTENKDRWRYYEALLALTSVSLALQVIGIVLAMVLAYWTYPESTPREIAMEVSNGSADSEAKTRQPEASPGHAPRAMRIMNDILTIIAAILMLLHVVTKSMKSEKITATDIIKLTTK